jgi:hypothetical protein
MRRTAPTCLAAWPVVSLMAGPAPSLSLLPARLTLGGAVPVQPAFRLGQASAVEVGAETKRTVFGPAPNMGTLDDAVRACPGLFNNLFGQLKC